MENDELCHQFFRRIAWVSSVFRVRRGSNGRLAVSLICIGSGAMSMALAAPVGGNVVAGAGVITQAGASTTVTQTTPNIALTWQAFNIDAHETVNFVQPSSTALAVNRILDTNGSHILGHLNANGQVYLINPNGILFGRDAQVNVGGLLASTLDVYDTGSPDGSIRFTGTGKGMVTNLGTINAAPGGYVALLGNQVENQGTLNAPGGMVALGAGDVMTLRFQGNELLQLKVERSVMDSLVSNGGLIRADGGAVLLTAGAAQTLLSSVVNNTGVIEARTVHNQDGTITLLGGMAGGKVNVGGTLDVSASDGGAGGAIETSAAHVVVADNAMITAAARDGISGRWLIDPVDFTIAAKGADMSGATLSAALGRADVTIASNSGVTGTQGNVTVNDVVNWNANRLTLQAQNNIFINTNLNGTGTAKLALEYGLGATADGNTSDYFLSPGTRVNLPAGANFRTRQGADGGVINYTVVTSLGAARDAQSSPAVSTLQGMAIPGRFAGNYVLGQDIDASLTAGWNSGAGFSPIGGDVPFTGTFSGLGHVINGLVINAPGRSKATGLFGTVDGAVIRDVGVVNGSVSGGDSVGGLVGFGLRGSKFATVSNASFSGSVSGRSNVGGLVGSEDGAINVDASYTNADVTGSSFVGGLMGISYDRVSNSYSSGTVTSSGLYTGGLIGSLSRGGEVSNSYSTASVNGASNAVGGLVGASSATITNSYATGKVTGPAATTGGLVGLLVELSGNTNSYWDTASSGQARGVGSGAQTGVTGMTFDTQTAATYGGWDFKNSWTIYPGHSYPLLRTFMTPLLVEVGGGGASQTVTYDGTAHAVGGAGQISAYSSYGNAVTPTANLMGTAQFDTNEDQAIHAGVYTAKPSGLYSNQHGYLIDYSGGLSLTIAPAPLTATANIGGALSKVYDGSRTTLGAIVTGGVSGAVGGDSVTLDTTGISLAYNSSHVADAKTIEATGTVSFALQSNIGSLSSDYILTQPDIAPVAGRITPAPLTATAIINGSKSKVYDGSAGAPGTRVTGDVLGAVAGDVLSLDTSGIAIGYDSPHVLEAKAIRATGQVGFKIENSNYGSEAGDYSLAQPVITAMPASIIPAPLTATVSIGGFYVKEYDQTDLAPGATVSGDLSGAVAGDKLAPDLSRIQLRYNDIHIPMNIGARGTVGFTIISSPVGSQTGDYALTQPVIAPVPGTITHQKMPPSPVGNPGWPGELDLSGNPGWPGETNSSGKPTWAGGPDSSANPTRTGESDSSGRGNQLCVEVDWVARFENDSCIYRAPTGAGGAVLRIRNGGVRVALDQQ